MTDDTSFIRVRFPKSELKKARILALKLERPAPELLGKALQLGLAAIRKTAKSSQDTQATPD